MQARLIFVLFFTLLLSACGGGSSSSGEAKGKSNSFEGTQTITLTNGSTSASEEDDFVATLDANFVSVIDENFNAKGELNSQNAFIVSSPMFSTSSGGVTCTGNVDYSGTINGGTISGSIDGEFICSEISFDVSGSFTATQ